VVVRQRSACVRLTSWLSADGSQLVVGAGSNVLLLEGSTGRLEKTLTGHTGQVFTVAYAADGKRFASGDKNKFVIVWSSTGQGLLKFTHGTPLQCLAYNPVTNSLASCSCDDFGLWVPGEESVKKRAVASKVLCADWTADGQRLALGLANGNVLICDSNGEETATIKRSAPVWCVAWNPGSDLAVDSLAVGCWDGTLSFYQRNGWREGADQPLGFDPCTLRFIHGGRYMVVAGSNRQALVMTRTGVPLGELAPADDWIWSLEPRPTRKSSQQQYQLASGTADGEVRLETASFSYVHGLWEDRYAFRDGMTDVVVQHLVTEQRVRVKCRALVKRIALYRNRLAVQLPDSINVYEISPKAGAADDTDDTPAASPTDASLSAVMADPYDMRYRPLKRISTSVSCSLLVVASRHVVMCFERRLQLLSLVTGKTTREWLLPATVRFLKVAGGPPGAEALLVGLKNGACLTVYLDNPFPVPVADLPGGAGGVKCLDLSPSKKLLAVVDEEGALRVYNVVTKEVVWEPEPTDVDGAKLIVNSAVFSSGADDVLVYTGNNTLCIKTADFPIVKHPMRGFVVGVRRSLVFVLHNVSVRTVDVPQTDAMHRFIELGELSKALAVASLGVTDQDWKALGRASLRKLKFDIAMRAFSKIRETKYLELASRLKKQVMAAYKMSSAGRSLSDAAKELVDRGDYSVLPVDASVTADVAAEVLAYEGDFTAAADAFLDAGMAVKAVDMYSDLRMWSQARRIAEESGNVDVTELAVAQARTAEQNGDIAAASSIFLSVGRVDQALRLWREHSMLAELTSFVEDTTPDDKEKKGYLRQAAAVLREAGEGGVSGARRAFEKLGDQQACISLLVEHRMWDDAVSALRAAMGQRLVRRQVAVAAAEAAAGSTAPLSLAMRELRGGDDVGVSGVRVEVEGHPLAKEVWVPLGRWLAETGQFEEARLAFARAGAPNLAAGLLRSLASNAIVEKRFADGARHVWRLADAVLDGATPGETAVVAAARRELYLTLRRRGEVLFAFERVHEFARAPFTAATPMALLNASATVLNSLADGTLDRRTPDTAPLLPPSGAAPRVVVATSAGRGTPDGVSQTDSLYALAKTAVGLGAYRSARVALELLSSRVIPASWRESVDLAALAVQAHPMTDSREVQPMCFRCGTLNPVMCPRGDRCGNCGTPFHRSMASFEPLPVVEFEPVPPLSMDQALSLMREAELGITDVDRGRSGGVQSLEIGAATAAPGSAFDSWLSSAEVARRVGGGPLSVPRDVLAALPLNQVVVVAEPGNRRRLFRVMTRSARIDSCPGCRHLFYSDELEMEILKSGCPACSYKGPTHPEHTGNSSSATMGPAS
jgi:intraflagellar transport protein 122